jgi:indolepyruvate ferredoxin oxidoreductase
MRDEYLDLVAEILPALTRANLHLAVALTSYPNEIRGFGHVKATAIKRARGKIGTLRAQFIAGARSERSEKFGISGGG